MICNTQWLAALAIGTLLSAGQYAAAEGDKAQAVDRSVQLYAREHLQVWNRDKAAGGEGALLGDFAYTRHQTDARDAFREIGWLTLPPGASIGSHGHTDNEDVYIIISGKGIFTDSTGKEYEVGPGDITIARPGQKHGLKNSGDESLVFLDLIAQTVLPEDGKTAEPDKAHKH